MGEQLGVYEGGLGEGSFGGASAARTTEGPALLV